MSRTAAIVRYFPRKRRNLVGWLIFLSFIVLNEMRGVYVVAEFLNAWHSVATASAQPPSTCFTALASLVFSGGSATMGRGLAQR